MWPPNFFLIAERTLFPYIPFPREENRSMSEALNTFAGVPASMAV